MAEGKGAVMVTLSEREDAEELAEQLHEQGYEPCSLHREMVAGKEEAERVDWVIEVQVGPHGGPAVFDETHLGLLAEDYGGVATVT